MRLSDFDYALPSALIATHPTPRRRDSRLLVVDGEAGGFSDRRFEDLPGYLAADDLLVLNDTRVIRARLSGRKETGGVVEILIERIVAPDRALAHVKASKPPRPGMRIELEGGTATVAARCGELYELAFAEPVEALLERSGEVPLPPYLGRAADSADAERYQTVFASRPGAVAAPTAGLHFDHGMLEDLGARGVRRAFVTLHVGAGTFQPLRAEAVLDNRLHAERVAVDASVCEAVSATRARRGRVVAVGTTSVRALESAAADDGAVRPLDGETDLFIVPGYRFRAVDVLLTNFHLPRSSLLMLVAAFGGTRLVLEAYRHAVAQQYRFYSYGDAMLVLPPRKPAA